MLHKDVHILIPGACESVTLPGKGNIARVTESRILRWRLSWMICEGPKFKVLLRGRQEGTGLQGGQKGGDAATGQGVPAATSGHQRPPAATSSHQQLEEAELGLSPWVPPPMALLTPPF